MTRGTRRQALFLLLAALLLAAGRAAADDDGGRILLEGPSWASTARGSYLLRLCPAEGARAVAFCLGGEDAPPSPATRKFTAFTRLAGMFMGRVDALEFGGWRMRFDLELR